MNTFRNTIKRKNPNHDRRASRRRILCLATFLVLVLAGALNPQHPGVAESRNWPQGGPKARESSDQVRGHERLLALLEDIKAGDSMRSLYAEGLFTGVGEGEVSDLLEGTDGRQRWRALRDVGTYELRAGQEVSALEHLEAAYELLPSLQDELTSEEVYDTVFRLGVGYMRLGETQNCAAHHNARSCILPIRGAAIHTERTGATQAIRYFREVTDNTPRSSSLHLKASWLMNIAYMTLGRYPDEVPGAYRIHPQVFASEEGFPRFENVAPKLRLATFNLAGGAAADDFTGDGYLDIMTTSYDTSGQMHFFVNQGDGTFTDRTQEAGLLGLYGGLNVVQADYDNDGDLDLYILRGAWLGAAGRHPNSLLRNNGGTFTDVTFEAGLGQVHYPTQTAAWADYDNDGDVDLYVGNEHIHGVVDSPSQLFRNNGDGTFTDVAAQAGVAHRRFVKAVVWGDYDNDRFPDLYVSTLIGPNLLYHNNGDGTFTDVAQVLGVTGPRSSFPTWFWDFDNDGNLDLYVSSYPVFGPPGGKPRGVAAVAESYLGTTRPEDLAHLYRGDGRGGFDEVAQRYNLTKLHLPMGANFGDLDHDGYLDFYLGTGYPQYEALMPNAMYRNKAGQGFVDVTFDGGFGHLQKGHAIAFADFEHDGDQDIFAQMGGAYPNDEFADALFKNPGSGNHWIAVHLVGSRSNRAAIGARIRVDIEENGELRSIFRHVNSGGSFGANPLRQTIGLGQASRLHTLEIYWPATDLTQTFKDVAMDGFVRIVEGEDRIQDLDL